MTKGKTPFRRKVLSMTRRELIDFCLTFPFSYEDYPFDEVVDDHAWTVMRYSANKKSFAFIYERDRHLYINLIMQSF